VLLGGCAHALPPPEPSFGVLGDAPYTDAEVARLDVVIDQINAQPLDFMVHVGDIGASNLACTDRWLLQRKAQEKGISTILVFEGWDAAGKGGAIRRITGALDARDYEVIATSAPTDEEKARHYLWRFWRHLSRAGRITIFDRSWYGRVLVERVEGFATEDEYRRGYGEINYFEEQLVGHGVLLMKFWMHITKDEQLRRFRDRKRTEYKRWKITPEDWRNRGRWAEYTHAVDEMVERTSTKIAPWTLVEANDKNFARIKVLKTLADRMEKRLKKS